MTLNMILKCKNKFGMLSIILIDRIKKESLVLIPILILMDHLNHNQKIQAFKDTINFITIHSPSQTKTDSLLTPPTTNSSTSKIFNNGNNNLKHVLLPVHSTPKATNMMFLSNPKININIQQIVQAIHNISVPQSNGCSDSKTTYIIPTTSTNHS